MQNTLQNVGANVVSIDPLSDDWYNNMFCSKRDFKSYNDFKK